MILRDYQIEAIDWLCKRKRGLLKAKAGSGKTLIGAGFIRKVVTSRTRTRRVVVGWLCNTLEQREQAMAAFAAFPELESLIELRVACAAGMPDFAGCDVLICDECHHAVARTWSEAIDTCKGAVYGFTATPDLPDPDDALRLRSIFGNAFYEVQGKATKDYLAEARVVMLTDTDSGLSAPIDAEIRKKIAWRSRFWRGSETELRAQVGHQVCMALGIVPNKLRNEAIIRTANSHIDDSTIVLVYSIEHGEELQSMIPNSELIHAKVGKRRRAAVIESFRAGETKCIVGTNLFSEGFDAPICNVFIQAGAGRSARAAEQNTGRALRKVEGKTHGTIYDFQDTQHMILQRQSEARQDVYRRLGYKFPKPPALL